ncbi:MAG: hypothetical protein WCV84_01290 [Patescibacteria group bacterium]
MTNTTQETWIKIFIGIGIGFILLVFAFSAKMQRVKEAEIKRADECRQQLRTDCKPSFLWWSAAESAKQGVAENE